jgi:hypothetical protein
MKKRVMTALDCFVVLGHQWQSTACPGWLLCTRCGTVSRPSHSTPRPAKPAPQAPEASMSAAPLPKGARYGTA